MEIIKKIILFLLTNFFVYIIVLMLLFPNNEKPNIKNKETQLHKLKKEKSIKTIEIKENGIENLPDLNCIIFAVTLIFVTYIVTEKIKENSYYYRTEETVTINRYIKHNDKKITFLLECFSMPLMTKELKFFTKKINFYYKNDENDELVSEFFLSYLIKWTGLFLIILGIIFTIFNIALIPYILISHFLLSFADRSIKKINIFQTIKIIATIIKMYANIFSKKYGKMFLIISPLIIIFYCYFFFYLTPVFHVDTSCYREYKNCPDVKKNQIKSIYFPKVDKTINFDWNKIFKIRSDPKKEIHSDLAVIAKNNYNLSTLYEDYDDYYLNYQVKFENILK